MFEIEMIRIYIYICFSCCLGNIGCFGVISSIYNNIRNHESKSVKWLANKNMKHLTEEIATSCQLFMKIYLNQFFSINHTLHLDVKHPSHDGVSPWMILEAKVTASPDEQEKARPFDGVIIQPRGNGAIFGMFIMYFLRIYWRLLRRLSFHKVLLGGKQVWLGLRLPFASPRMATDFNPKALLPIAANSPYSNCTRERKHD